ncbi:IS200/IS605 family transposase [Cupriavidus basilensis]|nr:IS200/IS605 family transposase [Cupriavidus basilensis]MDF3888866.1 IS200/IS605 family transposase [Cupriavidus basilensis]
MEPRNQSNAHAVYNLKLHIVFVTKYRRKTLMPELLAYLETAFAQILTAWRCELLEFGGELDHVHLLVSIHPALDISVTTLRRPAHVEHVFASPSISPGSIGNRYSGTAHTLSLP